MPGPGGGVVDLVGVVEEVEEVRGEPEVVQGRAQLVHHLWISITGLVGYSDTLVEVSL